MANQILLGRALDQNGYIAPAAKATIYADGTSTLITVYSDVAGTVVAANPIVADGDGFWPQRYVTEDAKAAVTTSADVALYTLDPAPTSQGTGASASQVSFAPTVPLPQTNVQAAIEAAAALAVSGFAAFGLGVTGNAELLANIDATGTGAGIYRFDGTTTGTFPTGVAAGDTGMVELWRQAGATAMMELHHATSNRVFRRRLTATVWGAWREIPVVDQATVQGDIIYRGSADFQRLAKGTAGQFLAMNSGATAPEWVTASEAFSSVVSLSGASPITVTTAVPANCNYIELWFNGMSLTSTGHAFVQLGDTAFVTTGYDSAGQSNGAGVTSAGGLIVRIGVAAQAFTGVMVLRRTPGTNIWVSAYNGFSEGLASYLTGAGKITLAAPLERIRVTATAANDFDGGGTVYAIYR